MGMNGTITLVSTKGGGCTKKVTVPVGMTAKECIYAELGVVDPATFIVTINGTAVKDPAKATLKDGDFVIVTPTNVKGS